MVGRALQHALGSFISTYPSHFLLPRPMPPYSPATYPLAACALAVFGATLLLRLGSTVATAFATSASSAALTVSAFANKQVTIKCASNGRYLEVGNDGWVYASSFNHNKAAARFDVVPVSPEMLRSLSQSREFHEQPNRPVGRWDMRPGMGSSWTEGSSWTTGSAASTSSFLFDEDDAEAEVRRSRTKEEEEEEEARRRLKRASERGAAGWVLLHSPFAGGYAEVVGRGEESEYVVRIAAESRLSYRSLFLLDEEAIWSHSVGGYLNWRQPTSSESSSTVRAHGNTEPFTPLRTLAPSARFRVSMPPPFVDVLSGIRCPADVVPYDWNLLLDAARAGACDAAGLATLRTAAAALDALHAALGDGFGIELEDLAASYRATLLDPEWVGTLDLQLRRCSETAHPSSVGFSWLDEASGDLVVNASRCPNAAYAEVVLRLSPDEISSLEMLRLPQASADGSAGTLLRAPLQTDAAFVLCEHGVAAAAGDDAGDAGDAGGADDDSSSEMYSEMYKSREEGELSDGEFADPNHPLLQSLWFRVSPQMKLHGGGRRRRDAEAASAEERQAASADEALEETGARNGTAEEAETAAEEAAAAAERAEGQEEAARRERSSRLSVLMLMLDATSRAHLQRSVPRSLTMLRALASSGAVSLYEFPLYSIVGFNSLPNMVPMMTGMPTEAVADLPLHTASAYGMPNDEQGTLNKDAPEPVWSAFSRRGFATYLLEEIHDGCSDLTAGGAPSAVSKVSGRSGQSIPGPLSDSMRPLSGPGSDTALWARLVTLEHGHWRLPPPLAESSAPRPLCTALLFPLRRRRHASPQRVANLLPAGAAPVLQGSGLLPPAGPTAVRGRPRASRAASRVRQAADAALCGCGHPTHGAAQPHVRARALHDAAGGARRAAARLPTLCRGSAAP